MPVSGTPGGGNVKLPQVKPDFLKAAKPAAKSPAAPAIAKPAPRPAPQPARMAAPVAAPLKPAAPLQRATPAKAAPAVSPAIQAKQNFAKAVANPNRAATQQIQKIQTRTKSK